MKVSEKILKKVKKIENGKIIRYKDLGLEPDEYFAGSKVMERLLKKGKLERISPGVFFKPKMTVFGKLGPDESEILKLYLFEDNERVGYLTGPGLYNSMALTTQVPAVYYAASRYKRISVKMGRVVIKPAKSYVDVNGQNYRYLQFLDALKDFTKILDLDTEFALGVLLTTLKKYNETELKTLIKYALKYPPRVRAFLGTLLEKAGFGSLTPELRKSLNPLSSYRCRISKLLPNANKWNIV